MTALTELASITTIPDYLTNIIIALQPYPHNIDENNLIPTQITSIKQFCSKLEAFGIHLQLFSITDASNHIQIFSHLCNQFNIIHLNNLLSPEHPSIKQQTILYDTIETTFASPTRLVRLRAPPAPPAICSEFIFKLLHNIRLHYGIDLEFDQDAFNASLPADLPQDQITTLTTLLQLSYPTPTTSSYFHKIFFPTLNPQELKEQLFQFYSKDIQIEDIFSGIIHLEEQSTIIAPTTFSSSEPNRITFKPLGVIETLLKHEIIPYTISLPGLPRDSIYSYLDDQKYGSLFRFALLTSLLQIKISSSYFSTLCAHLFYFLKQERSVDSFQTQRELFEERSQCGIDHGLPEINYITQKSHQHFTTAKLDCIATIVFGSYLLYNYSFLSLWPKKLKKAPFVPENFSHLLNDRSGLKYFYKPNTIFTTDAQLLDHQNDDFFSQNQCPQPTTSNTETTNTKVTNTKATTPLERLFFDYFISIIHPLKKSKKNALQNVLPVLQNIPQTPFASATIRQLVLFFQIVATHQQHQMLSQTYPIINDPITDIQRNPLYSERLLSQIQTNTTFLHSIVSSQILSKKRARALHAAIIKIQNVVEQVSDFTYSVAPFGSCISGLGQMSSDIDLKLVKQTSSDNSVTTLFSKIARALQARSDTHIVLRLFGSTARTKLLKIIVDGIPCDITSSNDQSDAKTQLLRTFIEFHPIVYPLVTLVKFWAKQRAIHDASAGFMNSFSVSLLVIFFLQSKGMLPVLHQNMPPNPRMSPTPESLQLATRYGLQFQPFNIIPLIVSPTSAEPPSPYFYLPSILQPLRPPPYGEYVNLDIFSEHCGVGEENDETDENAKMAELLRQFNELNCNNDGNDGNDANDTNVGSEDDEDNDDDDNEDDDDDCDQDDADNNSESMDDYQIVDEIIDQNVDNEDKVVENKSIQHNELLELISNHSNETIQHKELIPNRSRSLDSIPVPIYHLKQHLNPTITHYSSSAFAHFKLKPPFYTHKPFIPTLYSTDSEIDSFLLRHQQTLFSLDWSWLSHHSSTHKHDMNESNNQHACTNNNNQFCAYIGPSGIEDYLKFSTLDTNAKQLLPKAGVSLDTEQSWRYTLRSIEELRKIYPSHCNHVNRQRYVPPGTTNLHSVVIPRCPGADDPLWKQAFLLLQEFFFFYGFVFNPQLHVISVRAGHFTWLVDYHRQNVFIGDDPRLSLFIEDPFDPLNNCARAILPHFRDLIITEFRRAAILSLTNTPIHIILSPVTAEITGLYYFLQYNLNPTKQNLIKFNSLFSPSPSLQTEPIDVEEDQNVSCQSSQPLPDFHHDFSLQINNSLETLQQITSQHYKADYIDNYIKNLKASLADHLVLIKSQSPPSPPPPSSSSSSSALFLEFLPHFFQAYPLAPPEPNYHDHHGVPLPNITQTFYFNYIHPYIGLVPFNLNLPQLVQQFFQNQTQIVTSFKEYVDGYSLPYYITRQSLAKPAKPTKPKVKSAPKKTSPETEVKTKKAKPTEKMKFTQQMKPNESQPTPTKTKSTVQSIVTTTPTTPTIKTKSATPRCKYGHACSEKDTCVYSHVPKNFVPKTACRFGLNCKKDGCTYLHDRNYKDGTVLPLTLTKE